MLKDRKLQPPEAPPPWHSGAVYVLCLLSHGSGVRIPKTVHALIFYVFKVPSFLLRLVLALTLLLGLR